MVVKGLSREALDAALGRDTDSVFHLAAVVSAAAEADFDLGLTVNVDGTRTLLECCRRLPKPARLVFTSSIAAFGGALPARVPDSQAATPTNSYGAQKAIGELMVADYARKGFIDGRSLRLPTIVVRPGKPNKAASSFASGIIREPLNGEDAVLPVSTDVRHWFASPRSAIGFLLHAATLDSGRLGERRCLTMPGVSATVADEIEALRRVAGDAAVRRIRHEPDESVARIVASWPRAFDTRRAHELGFRADADFDAIVRAHIEDELGG
jgi:nucleoside-diphosphate-sugar epimerase